MNLLIFGATGMVGKELIKQALHNGHHVKAYGRNVFTEDLPKDDQLELIQGALFDDRQVYKALKNCDTVLSVIGGGINDTDVTRSLGMKNIVAQMEKAGVKRIVALGSMGSLNADEDTIIMETPEFPGEFYHVSKEHFKAYEFLKASKLDWTVVCAPDIVEAVPTGDFITKADYLPEPNKNYINSGDLALFMLSETEKREYSMQRVGISN